MKTPVRPGRGARLVASVIACILAAGLVAACTTEPPERLELTAADSGSARNLTVGQQMRVTLEANPTTGYQWSIDGELPPQLAQEGEPEYLATSPALGAAGTEAWTFTARQSGRADLKLKYWRSFEPTVAPIGTFTVTVEVE